MPRKLKVYRTPIGFHDAYVAASSQKAALEKWGVDVNLFARGVAEEVTDPKLMEEPLASPGKVVRKARGSIAEHMAALPPDLKADKPASKKAKAAQKPIPKRAPKPRPSRTDLDKAETNIANAENTHAAAMREIDARKAALERERKKLDDSYQQEAAKLQKVRAGAEKRYRAAVEAWRTDE